MGGFKFGTDNDTTGRMGCKGCKKKILKGTCRVGVAEQESEMKWYHPECVSQYRKTKKWWSSNCPPVEEFEGFESLNDTDKQSVSSVVEGLTSIETSVNQKTPSPKSSGDRKSSSKSPRKRKRGESSEEDNANDGSGSDGEETGLSSDESAEGEGSADEPQSKKVRQQKSSPKAKAKTQKVKEPAVGVIDSLNEEQQEKLDAYKEILDKKNVVQLKEILKMNDQIQSGKKSELINRVAEGKILGAIPRCPTCSDAFLSFNPATGIYACKGSYSDGAVKKCSFKSSDVVRRPWKEA